MRPGLIPGEGFNPEPFPYVAPQSRASRLVRVLVVVWLLGGLGFLVIKLFGGKPAPTPAPTANRAVAAISAEDLLRHLEPLSRRLAESGAKIRRAEAEIDRTVPALDRNFLPVEAQRLKNAAAVAEDARRELEQTRDEFEFVINSIRKDETQ